MGVRCILESVGPDGAHVGFRVRGLPLEPTITQIAMDAVAGQIFRVRPPVGFRRSDAVGTYTSFEEFELDYLADEPTATPEQVKRAFKSEVRQSTKDDQRSLTFLGALRLRRFSTNAIVIPMEVPRAGDLEIIFVYTYKHLELFGSHRTTSVDSVTISPNQAMQRTASKPAAHAWRVGHPDSGCVAGCSGLAVADLVSR
jgi:hypothetical protein